MEVLEGHLLHASGMALGIEEAFFDDKVNRHVSAMRINHYPAQATTPRTGHIRAGAHTDYGMMTILMGENEPGSLQVRTRDGRWIDVETRPEFFVINIGDLMMRWTNDDWLSNMHRVVNPPPDIANKVSRITVALNAILLFAQATTATSNTKRHWSRMKFHRSEKQVAVRHERFLVESGLGVCGARGTNINQRSPDTRDCAIAFYNGFCSQQIESSTQRLVSQ